MKLYSYWRSSTSYRSRIGLHLKGLSFETVPVDLLAGEQHSAKYRALNPGAGVPALVLDDGRILTQSMAILEWLDEVQPAPALLPADPYARARVRAAALTIASEIHPLNNTRVIKALKALGHTETETISWMNDWMTRGLAAFVALIDADSVYCFGDAPGLADICLVPQLYNARRWGCELAPFTRLTDIESRCLERPEFDAARPENQPEAG